MGSKLTTFDVAKYLDSNSTAGGGVSMVTAEERKQLLEALEAEQSAYEKVAYVEIAHSAEKKQAFKETVKENLEKRKSLNQTAT